MRGLFTLTFEVNGTDEDAIKAAGLELKRLFIAAAAKRTPGFREGTFHVAMDKPKVTAPPVPTPGGPDDPERLFDS